MDTKGSADAVWTRQAAQWRQVGAPLRPSGEDLSLYESVLLGRVRANGPRLRGLLLGVTPELAGLAWPSGTDLVAVDRCADMIERVWPGYPTPGLGALLADWLALPLPDRSRDVVIGDGSLNVIRYPDQTLGVLESAGRVLADDGRLVVRVFARPETGESSDEVFGAAMTGRIRGFHAFKLRLLMAVQGTENIRLRIGDVWQCWDREGPGAEALAGRTGWPLEVISTIDAYRDQDTLYSFPTLTELRALVAKSPLVEVACSSGSYELAERCPRLVLAHR